ncbi:MAG: glycosyltransferase family 4 protein [Limisphaerales bacterium]
MEATLKAPATTAAMAAKAPPRVAILTGGADKPYALGLAGSLLAEGVPFDFIGSDFVDGPELHGHPLVRFLNLRGDQNPDAPLARKVWRVLAYYFRLLGYAAESPAPVFHILWNNKLEHFDRTLLLLFYRLCGKRIVFTAHNVNVRRRDGNDSWFNRLTLRIQYRLVSHVFVHTERMRRELMEDFGVPAERASVIPFGINSTVPKTPLTTAEARRKLGLDATHKVVLFFGNIAPYKGVEHLVTATAKLAAQLPELRLVIAGRPKGEAEYWAGIEKQIATLSLRDRVVLRIEYVPDADTEIYFKAADVLALPYNHIFQSGVLFLGYNFGLPVVATDVGSLKDDIVEGRTGFVCRPRDPDDLARALAAYFGSELYRELPTRRAEVEAFATERYSWAKVAAITRKVYGAVAEQGGGVQ